MKQYIFSVLSVICALWASANSATISVVPSSSSVSVGDAVSVDVLVSDLGDAAAPSIGIFDFDFSFDNALLSFAGATFGTQLDLFGFGSDQIVDDSIPGIVNVFELSFDFASDLNDLQASSFTLATLNFTTLAVGSTALTVVFNSLGDSFGDPIPITQINNSMLSVNAPTSVVPLPGAAWIFLTGLVGLISRRFIR